MQDKFDQFDGFMLSIIAVMLAIVATLVLIGDQIGVTVDVVAPDARSSVSTSTDIRIQFDQPMEHQSVEDSFEIRPAVEGVFLWRGNTLVFTPTVPLAEDQVYEVRIADDARSTSGRRQLETLSFSFSTQSPVLYYLSPASGRQQAIWAFDVDTETAGVRFAPANGVGQFAIHAPTNTIAATVFAGRGVSSDIWLLDGNGENARQLTACQPDICRDPAWSADGVVIAYVRQRFVETGVGEGRVWLFNRNSGENVELSENSQLLGDTPQWNADDTIISFADTIGRGLRLVNLNNGALIPVPSSAHPMWNFHPLDNTLVFTARSDAAGQEATMLVLAEVLEDNRLNRAPLLLEAHDDAEPLWSPDGRYLAFTRRFLETPDTGTQIMLYNVRSDKMTPVTTDTSVTNHGLTWNASSSQLVFERRVICLGGAIPELWVYDIESSTLSMIVADGEQAMWLGGR